MAGSSQGEQILGVVILVLAGTFLGCKDPASEALVQPPESVPSPASAHSPSPPRLLPAQPGTRVTGHLASGEVHTYTVELVEKSYLLAQVEQRGVDVEVSVSDPVGQPILEVDSPIASLGSEFVPLVASASGIHCIAIQALDGETGGEYELTLVELRPTTSRDLDHAKAAILLSEADVQRKKNQSETLATAVEFYNQAIALPPSSGVAWQQVVALRRLGQVHLARQRPKDALTALRQALSFLRGRNDPQQEAGVLVSIGQILRRLDRREEARQAYEQAIEVARSGRAPLEEAAAWNNLADLQKKNGKLEKALAGYDRALLLWHRNGRKETEATALHNLGSLYLELNRLPEARDCLLQSLHLQRVHGNSRSRALTLIVLGQVYAWQGEYRSALSHYRQAMALVRRTGDRWSQAILLDRLGIVYLEMGDVRHALDLQERAAAMFRDLEDRERLAWVLVNLGWLHQQQGRPERALPLYREASGLFSPLSRMGQAAVSLGEALTLRDQADLAAARRKLEQALVLVESLRADAPGPSLRSSFFAARQLYYEEYVDLLMELHGRQPGKGWDRLALEASERTQARSFLDTLGGARIELQEVIDRELLRRDRELLDRLDALEAERMAGSLRDSLEAEQGDILLQRETLLARMREEEGRSLPPPPLPLTVAQMRSLVLDPESLLLVYALGEKRSFLWLVDQRVVRSFVLPGRERIEILARSVWESLSQGKGSSTQARLVLTRLASVILGPAADHLQAPRLLIVADGALRYIPFAALPEPGHGAPLLATHEIVYLDSPSVLAMQRQRLAGRTQAPLQMAVVADPVFQPDDPRVTKSATGPAPGLVADLRRSAEDLGLRGFRRLPESGREAAALLELVPRSKSLEAVGFAANREVVLSGALSHYRVVHFATHGLIHPYHPELSGLVLSLVDERGRPRNGFLRAYEFQKLGLSADLVVLSACRTALGQEVPGEGVVGMTRGLIEVPRLVVSLWSVEDRSTAELMGRFYQRMLQDRFTPSAALREAQLSMLREPEWSHPYQWAPFLFQGEWR
jgi:CHAT domain-containing protein/tetratricopeptide (TPR) repeat protein